MATGVNAIKIHKLDIEGGDNTDSLSEIKTLRLNFSDLGVKEFNVTSIAKSGDYYVLYVDPVEILESQNIVSNSTITSTTTVYTPGGTDTIQNYSSKTLISSSFNTSTGVINVDWNAPLNITVSTVASTSNLSTDFRVHLTGSFGKIYGSPVSMDFTQTGTSQTFETTFTYDNQGSGNNLRPFALGFTNANDSLGTVTINPSPCTLTVSQKDFNFDSQVIKTQDLVATSNAVGTLDDGSDGVEISGWTATTGVMGNINWNPYTPNNFYELEVTGSIELARTAGSQASIPLTCSFGGVNGNFDITSGTYTTFNFNGTFRPNSMTRDFAWAFAIDDDEWLSSTEVSYRSASLEINTPFTQSGIQVNAIMSPGVSSTGEPFNNSDYNATINNATDITPSTIYYDLDYSANAITPVNFDTVITGTATKAPIQDYNYFARRSIIPRYSGSKNTANDFNVLNGVIDREDAIIVDFGWGGGTYPMIHEAGGLKLNRLLLAGDNRDAISNITSEMIGFTGSLKQAFPLNSEPVISQYSTTSPNAAGAKVASYGFTVPQIPNYVLPDNSTGIPSVGIVTLSGTKYLQLGTTGQNSAFAGDKTSAGYITTGSVVLGAVIANEISSSIAEGDKWYVTFYEDMPTVLRGTLYPYKGLNDYYASKNSEGGYNFPLRAKGVWEITGATTTGTRLLSFKDGDNSSLENISIGDNAGYGMLLWKSISNNQFVLFNDATMSGVGKGAFISSTPSDIIETDFDYITRTYGQNNTTT